MTMGNNRWIVLANVSIGTFMSTLDGSIANVALPSIAGDLNAPIHAAQWVLTAYLLTICATLPIMGKISDMVGRSRIYNYGFLFFAFGSLLCAWSETLPLLIISRIVQALGAACLMSNSQAIIASIFTAGERGRALGVVGTTVSLGVLAGPGVGGILVDWLGWPSIFWINVPIGVIGFIAGLYLLPKDPKQGAGEPFDYTGSALFMTGIVLFLYTLSNAQAWGWGSAATLSGGVAAVILLGVFYVIERRTRYPMLDFTLYHNRVFALGNLAALLSFVAMFCANVMLPFYMEQVLGFTTEKTGYTMMAYPLAMAIVAPLSGWLSDRIGPSVLTTSGLAINILGFVMLAGLTTQESAWTVASYLLLFGIGGGLFQSPNNASVMGAVPKARLGTAGGLNALVRNIGMVMGISVSVSIYSTRLGTAGEGAGLSAKPSETANLSLMLSALHTVFWVAAAICLLALVLSSGRLIKGSSKPREASS